MKVERVPYQDTAGHDRPRCTDGVLVDLLLLVVFTAFLVALVEAAW